MSERIARFEDLALGYTPDLPDQKPLLWEDGRGVLFIDKTLQPLPGQIPLVSAGVPVNAVCNTGDLIFLGTNASALTYDLKTADLSTVTNEDDKSVGDWSFVPFGNWMLAAHNGKLWIWKPFDDNERILQSDGSASQESNPAYWPHKTFQKVTDFPESYKVKFLLKVKNFILAVCKDSVLWSSDDNPEDWTPREDNMAGDLFIRDIQGEIIGGAALENFALICTQQEVVIVQYISRPYIFSYKKLFDGAGVWGPRAICTANKSIFGFGSSGIWVSDGSGIQYIDGGSVGVTLNEKLDINRSVGCFCSNWGILQHVFFFIPAISDDNSEIFCLGFNMENSTWTQLDWDRVCSWKQYWVSSDGILFIDDFKNASNLERSDGKLPLIENSTGKIGYGNDGYGLHGYGGKLWFQV